MALRGRWHPASTGPLYRLKNLTLGVVGIGRIGGTFARRAGPWFGRTLGCDPYLEEGAWPEGIEQASLQGVFSEWGGSHEMGNIVRLGPIFGLNKRFLCLPKRRWAGEIHDRWSRPSNS